MTSPSTPAAPPTPGPAQFLAVAEVYRIWRALRASPAEAVTRTADHFAWLYCHKAAQGVYGATPDLAAWVLADRWLGTVDDRPRYWQLRPGDPGGPPVRSAGRP